MKRLYATLLSITFAITSVFAQQEDVMVGSLINAGDWFELERAYPNIKDNVQTPLLKQMAEVLLAANFNRPDELRSKLPTLIAEHQSEIGFEGVCNMVVMGATVEGFNGNYVVAADMIENIVDAVKSAGGSLENSGMEELLAYYDAMRHLPAPILEKPNTDIIIPFSEISDTLLYVPVTINEKAYDFIFDTGASTSLISYNLAKEIGAEIIGNSMYVGGATGGGDLQRAFIKEMNIGAISYKNVLTFVDSNPTPEEVSISVDAILGMDFIKRLGEVQIDMLNKTLIVPSKKTALPEYGSNIHLDQNILVVEVFDNNEHRMTFTLDTGHSGADLSELWYSKNAGTLSDLPTETQNSWGHGGKLCREIVRVDEYTLTIGERLITLRDIPAFTPTENIVTSQRYGNLGMGLLKRCEKVTINFETMFVKIE